ncbi:MAG: HD domain-containing protein [Myxococcales bacterium]|nr:HD domain-containing protein [Myxococcales bacterium]
MMRKLALPVLAAVARALLSRRTRRAIALVMGGLLVALGYVALRPAPPGEKLTPKERERIYAALLKHVERGGPNHLHSRRLYHYAPPFAEAAGANVHVVQAAALLHDATKEDGKGEPKEKFCTHGEQGADLTKAVLSEIGKSETFTETASEAVREHMGPCGFNWSYLSRRFMSKFCDRRFPKPSSAEAKVLYDIDMLDLMTVDGVVKVAELRQKNPEFEKEPLEASVRSGPDSAWKSVVDAKQTLLTEKAKSCGAALAEHTKIFVDGLDFAKVTDVPALKQAAAAYLVASPLPSCLPVVPPLTDGPSP